MYKKSFIIFLVVLALFSQTGSSLAQVGSTIYNPYGDDYREPKIYGETITPPPLPMPTPVPQEQNIPVNNNQVPQSTAVIETSLNVGNFFDKVTSQKLKIDVHGIGKSCQVGNERPVPWTLANAGVGIDSKEALLMVLNQAVQSDYRIRHITVRGDMLEIDYLQPARLFGVLPINYLFKVKTDISTFVVTVENPKWLSFGMSYHAQVSQTLTSGLSQIYTPKNMEYISKQNNFYKHSFATAATSAIMTPIDVYPFANTFWICTIVPFFVIFLLLFGLLFGYILYLLAKRRQVRYVRKFNQAHDDHGPVHRPAKQFTFTSTKESDEETLDDYIASKRFK